MKKIPRGGVTQLTFIFAMVTGLWLAAPARGQTDERLLLDPWQDNNTYEISADKILFPVGHFGADGSHAELAEGETLGRWRLMDQYDLNPSLGYDFRWLDVRNGDSIVPRHLEDKSLGGATPLGQSGPWFATASFAIGYAGDNAFADDRSLYGRGTIGIGRQFRPDTDLLMLIDYNGNREFLPDIPLLAVEYRSALSPRIQYVVGFPESEVTWEPNDKLTVDVTYQVISDLKASIDYNVTPQHTVFLGYDSIEDPYNDDQLPKDRRLYFQEQRAEVGVRYTPKRWMTLTLAGGYAYDRGFSSGFDDRNLSTVTKLTSQPYIRASIKLNF
jgi:hypothetical protein